MDINFCVIFFRHVSMADAGRCEYASSQASECMDQTPEERGAETSPPPEGQ